jgi:aspartate-semialdehyde dehydrogenase
MGQKPQIAVVGATGVVGQELLATLAARGHPSDAVTALASERSAGRELAFGEETVPVENATEGSFRGVKLAYFATPAEVSKVLAPAAQQAGSWAVDLSSAFRLDPGVPLVLPAVNLAVLREPFRGRIVSCPSAVTTALVTALEPLRARFGVEGAFATALLGVSSAGARGLEELQQQTADLLSGREPEVSHFPHRIGFNLIPQVGDFDRSAEWSSEELSWTEESARIWSAPGAVQIRGTAIQAPAFYGHLITLEVQLASAAAAADVRAALKSSPHLKLLDAPTERVYPMPMSISGDPAVHVGRVRPLPGGRSWFTMVAAVDNARRGAALNAIEIGQALLAREETA